MDETDVAILREVNRDRIMLWGSLDLRVSAERIAKRLEISPSTVRTRVAAWEESGFLLGHEVWPSLYLFGVTLVAAGVRMEDPRAKPAMIAALSRVDGVMNAVDHVGPWIGFVMAAGSDETPSVESRLDAISRLPGVAETQPPFRVDSPKPTIVPSPLDWRILNGFRMNPRGSPGDVATAVGVSTRTLMRRVDALVRGRAVWSFPLLDFSAFEGGVVARLILIEREGADPRAVEKALAGVVRGTVIDHEYRGAAPGSPAMRDSFIHLRSPGEAEAALLAALEVPGIAEGEMLFPKRLHAFASWVDERLARRVKETARAPA